MIAILVSVTDTTERANHQIHRHIEQVENLLYWRCTPDNLLPISQSHICNCCCIFFQRTLMRQKPGHWRCAFSCALETGQQGVFRLLAQEKKKFKIYGLEKLVSTFTKSQDCFLYRHTYLSCLFGIVSALLIKYKSKITDLPKCFIWKGVKWKLSLCNSFIGLFVYV